MNVTLEMIDELRSRVNVTYEEAKDALERNEGDLVKSIIYLERKRNEKTNAKTKKKEEFSKQANKTVNSIFSICLVIKNDKKTFIDIPLIIAAIFIVLAPYLTIPALIIALVLGNKIRIKSYKSTSSKIRKNLEKAGRKVKKSTEKIFEEEEDNIEEDSGEDEITIE